MELFCPSNGEWHGCGLFGDARALKIKSVYLHVALSTDTFTISTSNRLLHVWVTQDGVGKREMVSESTTPVRKEYFK